MIVATVYAHCHHCPKTHQSRWRHRTDRFLVESSPLRLLHNPTLWTPLPVMYGGIVNILYLTLRTQSLMTHPWQLQLNVESPALNLGFNFNPLIDLTYWRREMWSELNLVYYRLDRHHTPPITIWFHLGSSHCIASPLVYNSQLFFIARGCVPLILLVMIISTSASFLHRVENTTTTSQ